MPADPARWAVRVRGAGRLAASLAAHAEQARLWKRLATLRTDVPLPGEPEELRWRGAPPGPWRAFCARHGLGGLAERPERLRRSTSS